MPMSSSTLKDWLTTVIQATAPVPLGGMGDIEVYAGPHIPKMPDRIAIITAVPGVGYLYEGAADQIGFQTRIRGMGSPDDHVSYSDAETLAFALDSLIFSAAFPVIVDGQVIVRAFRLGGQPAPMSPAPDDADRYEFSCNYVAIVGNPVLSGA